MLFSGTVRSNLDPFSSYTDHQLWTSLERSFMKEKVVEIGGLDAAVQAGGENFSVGQK